MSKIGMGATLSANAIHLDDVNMIVDADPSLYLPSTVAGSRPIYEREIKRGYCPDL